jgi:hypothetical protein
LPGRTAPMAAAANRDTPTDAPIDAGAAKALARPARGATPCSCGTGSRRRSHKAAAAGTRSPLPTAATCSNVAAAAAAGDRDGDIAPGEYRGGGGESLLLRPATHCTSDAVPPPHHELHGSAAGALAQASGDSWPAVLRTIPPYSPPPLPRSCDTATECDDSDVAGRLADDVAVELTASDSADERAHEREKEAQLRSSWRDDFRHRVQSALAGDDLDAAERWMELAEAADAADHHQPEQPAAAAAREQRHGEGVSRSSGEEATPPARESRLDGGSHRHHATLPPSFVTNNKLLLHAPGVAEPSSAASARALGAAGGPSAPGEVGLAARDAAGTSIAGSRAREESQAPTGKPDGRFSAGRAPQPPQRPRRQAGCGVRCVLFGGRFD